MMALACGPLANDIDADGDILIPELVSDAQHGTVTVWGAADGTFDYATYLPADDFNTGWGDQPGGAWDSDQLDVPGDGRDGVVGHRHLPRLDRAGQRPADLHARPGARRGRAGLGRVQRPVGDRRLSRPVRGLPARPLRGHRPRPHRGPQPVRGGAVHRRRRRPHVHAQGRRDRAREGHGPGGRRRRARGLEPAEPAPRAAGRHQRRGDLRPRGDAGSMRQTRRTTASSSPRTAGPRVRMSSATTATRTATASRSRRSRRASMARSGSATAERASRTTRAAPTPGRTRSRTRSTMDTAAPTPPP